MASIFSTNSHPEQTEPLTCAALSELSPVKQPLFSHITRAHSVEETIQQLQITEVNCVERSFQKSEILDSALSKLETPLRAQVRQRNWGLEHGEPRGFFSCTFHRPDSEPVLHGSFMREVSLSRAEESELKRALTELVGPLRERYPHQSHQVYLGLLMSIEASSQTGNPAHTDYDSVERAMWYPNTNDQALHIPDHQHSVFNRAALFQSKTPESDFPELPVYRGQGGNFFYLKCEHAEASQPLVHWSPPGREQGALYFRSRVLSEKFEKVLHSGNLIANYPASAAKKG